MLLSDTNLLTVKKRYRLKFKQFKNDLSKIGNLILHKLFLIHLFLTGFSNLLDFIRLCITLFHHYINVHNRNINPRLLN